MNIYRWIGSTIVTPVMTAATAGPYRITQGSQ